MISVGIVSNLKKDPQGEYADKIIDGILERNMQALVAPTTYNFLKKGILLDESDLYQSSDLILVLGGDGTILNTARQAAIFNKPILGINIGRLGFLAEAEFSDFKRVLDAIAAGSYKIEKRMMLEADHIRDNQMLQRVIALNDIAIAKGSFARMIHLKAYINNEFINEYSADGLLISSPTGSTAYSLSAGGPIINPSMECLLLTPICPHTLGSRPIVTDAGSHISIEVNDKGRDITITIDGQEAIDLLEGDKVVVKKAEYGIQLIRVAKYCFFKLLRDKLSVRI